MKITNFESNGLDRVEKYLSDINTIVSLASLTEMLKTCNISFILEGISRTQSTLICELGDSYVQQSQRYVIMDNNNYIRPEFYNDRYNNMAISLIERAFDLYNRMSELKSEIVKKGRPRVGDYVYGISIEDARYILPLATKTNITVAMSGDKLIDLFSLGNRPAYVTILGEIINKLYIPYHIKNNILHNIHQQISPFAFPDYSKLNDFYSDDLGKINEEHRMVLLHSFDNLDVKVGLGALTSTSSKPPSEILEKWGDNATNRSIETEKRVLGYGHTSISEQARTTFGMMCSLVTYHQQIRHRLPKVYSERLEDLVEQYYRRVFVPDSIKNSKFADEYTSLVTDFKLFRLKVKGNLLDKYNECINMLLNCEQLKIIISTNARIDCQMLKDRTCETSQTEIRELSRQKLSILRKLSPVLYEDAIPPCVHGKCKEGGLTCGKVDEVKKYFLGDVL